MSAIKNNTARQFNLKCIGKNGNRVTVRIAPGLNVVDTTHWEEFVSKDGKNTDPYVETLRNEGALEYGVKIEDLAKQQKPDTKSKSKSSPTPKPSVEQKAV